MNIRFLVSNFYFISWDEGEKEGETLRLIHLLVSLLISRWFHYQNESFNRNRGEWYCWLLMLMIMLMWERNRTIIVGGCDPPTPSLTLFQVNKLIN